MITFARFMRGFTAEQQNSRTAEQQNSRTAERAKYETGYRYALYRQAGAMPARLARYSFYSCHQKVKTPPSRG
ncbi:hypothetical protein ACLHDD_07585 [Pantoea sp. NSTU24]|uniref:hypothetical protein n=1 Tax=Pantoea sp. NSTU24 TaxID=3391144 RepID=UPI003D04FD56